jgi:iron complex outermembrane recepter protein
MTAKGSSFLTERDVAYRAEQRSPLSHRWEAFLVVGLLVGGVLGPVARAQESSIAGIVVDQSGAAIAGARVIVTQPRAASTVTDADGRFVLGVPSTGRVTLQVERPLFEAQQVSVAAGAARVRVVLEIEGVSENVRVVSPIVDATTFDTFGGSRAVVAAAQIESLNAVDLASALRRTPGVTISRFNPVGAFGGGAGGAVHIRGMGASRPGGEIKTYVDGVPFYMGIWGHPLLDLLPVNGMERVSVLKGPQPHLFGNTFSAVDLGTRRARGRALEGSFRVSGGAFSTLVEQADVAARIGQWDVAAAQGFARSAGHREGADGRLVNGFGRLGYRWNDQWSVSGMVLHLDNTASDPGQIGRPETRTGRYETSGTLVALTLAHDHQGASGTLQLYANRGEGNWFDQPAPDGDTLTGFALTGIRWREQAALWRGGTLRAGLDVDRIDGEVQFNRVAPAPAGRFEGEALTVVAPHVAVEQTVEAPRGWTLTPSAGIRYYAHSDFDREAAPHVGVVARNAGTLALRATYTRGVNYPGQDVVVLSSLIPPLAGTWRQLEAETMDHVGVGAAFWPRPTTSVDAAYFNDRLKNRYLFAFPPVVSFPTFTNLGTYRVRGAEVSVLQRLGDRWQAFGGVTVLDSSLERLPYAPSASLVFGVTGAIGRFRISVDSQSQSGMFVLSRDRTAGAANPEQVDGFTVVNLRPSYVLPALDGRGEVFVAIENLFDQAYAYRPGYPMPGPSVQAGFSIGTRRR